MRRPLLETREHPGTRRQPSWEAFSVLCYRERARFPISIPVDRIDIFLVFRVTRVFVHFVMVCDAFLLFSLGLYILRGRTCIIKICFLIYALGILVNRLSIFDL